MSFFAISATITFPTSHFSYQSVARQHPSGPVTRRATFLIAPRERALERPCSKATSFAAGDTMSTVDANERKRIRNDYYHTAAGQMRRYVNQVKKR